MTNETEKLSQKDKIDMDFISYVIDSSEENSKFFSETLTEDLELNKIIKLMYVKEKGEELDCGLDTQILIDVTLPKNTLSANPTLFVPSHHIKFKNNIETNLTLIDNDIHFLCSNYEFIGCVHYLKTYSTYFDKYTKKMISKEEQYHSETYCLFYYDKEKEMFYRYVVSPKKWEQGERELTGNEIDLNRDFSLSKDNYNSVVDCNEDLFRLKVQRIIEEACVVNKKPIISTTYLI